MKRRMTGLGWIMVMVVAMQACALLRTGATVTIAVLFSTSSWHFANDHDQ